MKRHRKKVEVRVRKKVILYRTQEMEKMNDDKRKQENKNRFSW